MEGGGYGCALPMYAGSPPGTEVHGAARVEGAARVDMRCSTRLIMAHHFRHGERGTEVGLQVPFNSINGGQFDFVYPSATTPHAGPQYREVR